MQMNEWNDVDNVTFDHRRWYTVVRGWRSGHAVYEMVISSGEGDGTIIYGSVSEYEEDYY